MSFDQNWFPVMQTIGDTSGSRWTCAGPNEFDQAMVHAHSNLTRSFRMTWDVINVTRNDQNLGSLYLVRQCLQLWESEIEKWGCKGLGEELGDKWLVFTSLAFSTTKLTEHR